MDSSSPALARVDRSGRRTETLVLAVVFVLVNLAGALWQQPFYFHDDQGWEGVAYLSMARQVAEHGLPILDDAPEVYRLGGPLLAGWIQRFTGCDPLTCFKLVNGTANALTLALLVLWLRRFLADWRVRTALGIAFLLQWDTPVRWMYFFPPHTDPWMWVFLLAGLLALERYREQPTPARLAAVTVVTMAGVFFREIVMVVALMLPFSDNPLRAGALRKWWRGLPPRLVPLAGGVLSMAAVRLVARRTNGYGFAWTALHYLYAKPWPVYLLSWFLAFGPLLWLAIFRARKNATFLAGRQHFIIFLAAFAALADVGGSDTERFLYWTMPVVYLLVGFALEDGSIPRWMAVVIALAQLIASRAVFWPLRYTPSDAPRTWPLFTPLGINMPFDDLYTDTQPRLFSFVSLLEYLGFGAVLGLWLFWRAHRARADETLPAAPAA